MVQLVDLLDVQLRNLTPGGKDSAARSLNKVSHIWARGIYIKIVPTFQVYVSNGETIQSSSPLKLEQWECIWCDCKFLHASLFSVFVYVLFPFAITGPLMCFRSCFPYIAFARHLVFCSLEKAGIWEALALTAQKLFFLTLFQLFPCRILKLIHLFASERSFGVLWQGELE